LFGFAIMEGGMKSGMNGAMSDDLNGAMDRVTGRARAVA